MLYKCLLAFDQKKVFCNFEQYLFLQRVFLNVHITIFFSILFVTEAERTDLAFGFTSRAFTTRTGDVIGDSDIEVWHSHDSPYVTCHQIY